MTQNDRVQIRLRDGQKEKLARLAERMREAYGLSISPAEVCRAALDKGIEAIEAQLHEEGR